MKAKYTRNQIAAMPNVYSVGYCDLQCLLRGVEPIGYNSGVYGWNYDVYSLSGVTICTGYRGMPGKNVPNVAEWERKAAAICSGDWKEWSEKLESLRADFVRALMEG